MKSKLSTNTKCSKRTTIKGKAFIGVDLHDSSTCFHTIDSDGGSRTQSRIPTCESLLIDQVNRIDADEIHVAIEETALTHWAVTALRPFCTSVISCDPKENHWISRNSNKADEPDSERLARLHRMGELKEVYHTDDPDRYQFKVSVQHYLDLVDEVIRAKNKVKMFLQRMGRPGFSGDMIYSPKNRAEVLDLMPNADAARCIDRYLRHVDYLIEEVKQARKEYEALGKKYAEIQRFLKMPGVGSVTAHTFSGIIVDPNRFQIAESLNRFAGLGITSKSSDGKALGYERLDKSSGNPIIKQVTYRIFLGAVSAENEIKEYYEQAIRFNGGNKKRARLTTQRKILETLWVIWTKCVEYDPKRFVHGGETQKPSLNNRRARRAKRR